MMTNGVYLAILSSLLFSIMNVLVKLISSTIPTAEIVFFRGLIGVVAVYLMMRHSKVTLSNKGLPLLLLSGILGFL
jgi:drug/metabolite transporter (DMT)-like permease